MSFICQNPKCKKTIRNDRPTKIILETRPRVYTQIVTDAETGSEKSVMVGRGSEIVREISVCRPCANRHDEKARQDTVIIPAEAPLGNLVNTKQRPGSKLAMAAALISTIGGADAFDFFG